MKSIKFPGLLTAALLAFTLLLGGCASDPTPARHTLRLYVLDCGSIDVLDISMFQPGVDVGQQRHLTDSCYLIVHPKGVMIWDTGLPDALAKEPGGKIAKDNFVLRVNKTLLSQLYDIGYPPKTVRLMGLSHLHGDHVGNANLFPGATVLIQVPEYGAAFSKNPQAYGYNPADYASLHRNPIKILHGDYDVFGDGTVVIKSTPGHTPGHQSLFLKLARTGNILLSGDMVHYMDNWDNKRVPSINYDKAASLKSMQDMEKFMEDNHAELWIQHDAGQNAGIRHAPYYYE